VELQRDNIVARLDGDIDPLSGGRLVLLEVHQDTIPVEGMTIEPFAGELRGDRVYGRGACDIKGAMACMLAALARLADDRPAGMPTIVLACTVNEEYGFSGARQLTELWSDPGHRSRLLPRPPDAAIVAEPTELNVVVAHKGVVRWRCHTRGRAAHSSAPGEGQNAIYSMRHVLEALEHYAERVVPHLAHDALLGGPSLSVGTIQGGVSNNTIPDYCSIEIDRRVLPSEDSLLAYQHAVQFISSRCAPLARVEHDVPYLCSAGLAATTSNRALAERIVPLVQPLGVAAGLIGVPFGTDAAAIASTGIPTVVFGPGSIRQAHTADEWIAVEQLELGAEAYYRICAGL
jgi:acetylornithine deacetylase